MIVVVWRTTADIDARVIAEYTLPKSAWTVAVVETDSIGPGTMHAASNAADGIDYARRAFEARTAGASRGTALQAVPCTG